MAKSKKAEIEMRADDDGEAAFIAGTAVRVSDVARLYPLMQEKIIIERMQHVLPNLTQEQIAAAIDYWRAYGTQIQTQVHASERYFIYFQWEA